MSCHCAQCRGDGEPTHPWRCPRCKKCSEVLAGREVALKACQHCGADLCPECPQFVCADCEGTFCAAYAIKQSGVEVCPICFEVRAQGQ